MIPTARVRPRVRFARYPSASDYTDAAAVLVTLAGLAGWVAVLARIAHQ